MRAKTPRLFVPRAPPHLLAQSRHTRVGGARSRSHVGGGGQLVSLMARSLVSAVTSTALAALLLWYLTGTPTGVLSNA